MKKSFTAAAVKLRALTNHTDIPTEQTHRHNTRTKRDTLVEGANEEGLVHGRQSCNGGDWPRIDRSLVCRLQSQFDWFTTAKGPLSRYNPSGSFPKAGRSVRLPGAVKWMPWAGD